MRRRAAIGLAALALAGLPAAASAAATPFEAIRPTAIPAAGGLVAIAGKTKLTSSSAPNTLVDTGTVIGRPFGQGTIELAYTLYPRRGFTAVTFTIANAQGTVTGVAFARYTTTRLGLVFTGAGRLTGGTGAYAGQTSGVLQFDAAHSKTGQREVIRFVGTTADPGGTAAQQLDLYRSAVGGARPSRAGLLRGPGGGS